MVRVSHGLKAVFCSSLLKKNCVSVEISGILVCKSDDGYDIVIDEYKKNAHLINAALDRIKGVYLP